MEGWRAREGGCVDCEALCAKMRERARVDERLKEENLVNDSKNRFLEL